MGLVPAPAATQPAQDAPAAAATPAASSHSGHLETLGTSQVAAAVELVLAVQQVVASLKAQVAASLLVQQHQQPPAAPSAQAAVQPWEALLLQQAAVVPHQAGRQAVRQQDRLRCNSSGCEAQTTATPAAPATLHVAVVAAAEPTTPAGLGRQTARGAVAARVAASVAAPAALQLHRAVVVLVVRQHHQAARCASGWAPWQALCSMSTTRSCAPQP